MFCGRLHKLFDHKLQMEKLNNLTKVTSPEDTLDPIKNILVKANDAYSSLCTSKKWHTPKEMRVAA